MVSGLYVSGAVEWRRQWHPTPVLLPGKSHGWRSLVGCSPWGCEESDTTERLHFHLSLSCTGEGNGNPLQHSCLENPRDGGAWWAAVYGVARVRHNWSDLAAAAATVFQNQTDAIEGTFKSSLTKHIWGAKSGRGHSGQENSSIWSCRGNVICSSSLMTRTYIPNVFSILILDTHSPRTLFIPIEILV